MGGIVLYSLTALTGINLISSNELVRWYCISTTLKNYDHFSETPYPLGYFNGFL